MWTLNSRLQPETPVKDRDSGTGALITNSGMLTFSGASTFIDSVNVSVHGLRVKRNKLEAHDTWDA